MLFFFYGPDDYRAKQKIIAIKQKFITEVDPAASGIENFSGQWTLPAWREATVSDSLFTRRKLIIVEDLLFKKDKNFLEAWLELVKVIDCRQDIWVFYEPQLVQGKKQEKQQLNADGKPQKLTVIQKKVVDWLSAEQQQYFPYLGKEALRWLLDYLAAYQIGISKEAAQLLLTAVGGEDLWRLSNESAKLAAYAAAKNKTVIETEDVRLLINDEHDQSIFALIDAISQRRKAEAVKLLEEQSRDGLNEAYLSSMLLRQFRILLIIKTASESSNDPKNAVAFLKLHPYVLQKSVNQARNFKLEELREMFDWLVEGDAFLKSGRESLIQRLTRRIAAL